MATSSRHECGINLYCCSSQAEREDVAYALASLGYRVNIQTFEHVIPRTDTADSTLTVVVVGSHAGREEFLREVARQLGHRSTFGIFVGDATGQIIDLANCFDEFVGWPINIQELSYRFGRYRNACSPFPSAAVEVDIDREFSRLTMVGESAPFQEALAVIDRIARCDATALIEGETGTGKELAARAIHYQSARNGGPFVPVNCGLLTETLLANELFGHERGAFTDAADSHDGLIAQTEGGSLFLDEVDTLCYRGQVSLLRVLEEKEFRPLGGRRSRSANIRVLAASNSPLVELVEQKAFRADLYYRLSEVVVTMPPLRDRGRDIEILARHFVGRCNRQWHQDKVVDAAALARLRQYDWPGNIRELQNRINREYLIQDGTEISLDVPKSNSTAMVSTGIVDLYDFAGTSFNEAKARILDEFEDSYLRWLMLQTGGNVSQAAKRAGKERRALGKLLKKHSIDRNAFDRRGSANSASRNEVS